MATEEERLLQERIENDEQYRRELFTLFKNLRAQAVSNLEYFREGKGVTNERFQLSFSRLYDHLDSGIEPGVDYFSRILHLFDLDVYTPANGYRSIIKVIHRCCTKLLQLTRHITVSRESFLFRAGHYGRELTAYVNTLGQLRACMYYLHKLISYCNPGDLFPDQDTLPEDVYRTAEQIMQEFESLSQEPFYGRCLGFQFCDSMVKPLTTILVAMASYGDGYVQNSRMMKYASQILGSGRYFLDVESRAAQIVNLTRNNDIAFCKSFWGIAESDIMHTLPLMMVPSVEVDKVIILPPTTFELQGRKGSVRVTPPCAHSGPAPINTRLISYEFREGQEQWRSRSGSTPVTPSASAPQTATHPPSSCLLLHAHGGGFVAQSSASHRSYLRPWAKELGLPIFCVDYSLAPENPFPRQLEEVVYAYCWALKNAQSLGWTGEKVVFTGDSAGGNIVISAALRAVAMGVRAPDGILCSYGTVLIRYTPSPSRMLSLMDPLLPIGIVGNILSAYSGMDLSNLVAVPYDSCGANVSKTTSTQSLRNSGTHQSLINGHASNQEISEKTTQPQDEKSAVNHDSSSVDGQQGVMTSSQLSGSDCQSSKDSGFQSPEDSHCNHDSGDCPSSNPAGKPVEWDIEEKDEDTSTASHGRVNSEDHSSQLRHRLRLELTSPDSKTREYTRMLNEESRGSIQKSPSMPVFGSLRSSISGTPVDPPNYDNSPCNFDAPFGAPPTYAQMRHFAQSPVEQFRNMPIARNPYMSPYFASEDMLRSLPPIKFVACHLDPMLDDSVMFARRLRKLGKQAHLDVIDDLPHGFLNFVLVSQDAKAASDLCVTRIRELFGLHLTANEEYDIIDSSILNDSEEECEIYADK